MSLCWGFIEIKFAGIKSAIIFEFVDYWFGLFALLRGLVEPHVAVAAKIEVSN